MRRITLVSRRQVKKRGRGDRLVCGVTQRPEKPPFLLPVGLSLKTSVFGSYLDLFDLPGLCPCPTALLLCCRVETSKKGCV